MVVDMENMLEIFVENAKEQVNKAMDYAMQIESSKNKTECLNAEYHMGQFSAYMDMIENLSMEKFVELGESTKDMRQFILEGINKLYR